MIIGICRKAVHVTVLKWARVSVHNLCQQGKKKFQMLRQMPLQLPKQIPPHPPLPINESVLGPMENPIKNILLNPYNLSLPTGESRN